MTGKCLVRNGEKTYPQWIVAIIANATVFSYGLQAGWISPMTKTLQSDQSPIGYVTDYEMSLIASVLCISAMISTPLYCFIADKYGRKIAIVVIAFMQLLSWTVKLLSKSALHLIIARILCGIASGGCFGVVPMYTKEISQDNIRGRLGSLMMLLQNIGILVMYAIGVYVEYYTILFIVIWLPLLNFVLIAKAPESPSYLVKIGKMEEATKTLSLLRGLKKDDKIIAQEIKNMQNDDAYFKTLPKITFRSILKEKIYCKCFLIILAVITAQACNGNFAILTYASSIMKTSGVTMTPELQTLSFPVVMILGSLISMSSVEKFGRKPILTTAFGITGICFTALGSLVLIQNQGGTTPSWLPVTTITVSVFMYGFGILPIPYIMMSEMLNFQIRSRLIGIIVAYAWFISFLQLVFFPSISNAVGMYTTFYGFAVINFLGLFAALVLLPETKGKIIEEIEEYFRKKYTKK